jgi:hypothetical protein
MDEELDERSRACSWRFYRYEPSIVSYYKFEFILFWIRISIEISLVERWYMQLQSQMEGTRMPTPLIGH